MSKWLDRAEVVLMWSPVVLMVAFLVLFAMALNGNEWALRGWGI